MQQQQRQNYKRFVVLSSYPPVQAGPRNPGFRIGSL
jgi:hypothetical protein